MYILRQFVLEFLHFDERQVEFMAGFPELCLTQRVFTSMPFVVVYGIKDCVLERQRFAHTLELRGTTSWFVCVYYTTYD